MMKSSILVLSWSLVSRISDRDVTGSAIKVATDLANTSALSAAGTADFVVELMVYIFWTVKYGTSSPSLEDSK